MNLVVGIYAVAALASSFAAVLAWVSKLWWAKEYTTAKNETIRAKEAQIELLKTEVQNLRELTPMKLREYFVSVKEQLEEYNDKLREELKNANEEIKKKDSEILQLMDAYPQVWAGGPEPSADIPVAKVEAMMRNLRATKESLEKKARSLEQKLQRDVELRQNLDRLLGSSN